MSQNMILAVQITAIGMGLVFSAILLLWGVMALLVRLSGDQLEADEDIIIILPGQPSEANRKKLAAIAAVAVALGRQSDVSAPHHFPLPPTATVSAWQSVLRTRMLTKRRLGK